MNIFTVKNLSAVVAANVLYRSVQREVDDKLYAGKSETRKLVRWIETTENGVEFKDGNGEIVCVIPIAGKGNNDV